MMKKLMLMNTILLLYEQNQTQDRISFMDALLGIKILPYIGLSILFLLIIFTLFLLIKLTTVKRIEDLFLKSQKVEDKFNLILKTGLKNYSSPYRLTEADVNLIVDRVLECMRLDEIENQQKNKIIQGVNAEIDKFSYKYLKGKTGKYFSRAENNPTNSFFRLYNEKDDYALFEFNGNEAEALANRIFDEDVCKIVSGGYQNAQSVTNVKPGKIKLIGEQWEVIEPIKIKLD